MLPPVREKKTVRMDVPETAEEKEEKREAAREMAAFAAAVGDDQAGTGMKEGLQSPTTPTGGQQVSLTLFILAPATVISVGRPSTAMMKFNVKKFRKLNNA